MRKEINFCIHQLITSTYNSYMQQHTQKVKKLMSSYFDRKYYIPCGKYYLPRVTYYTPCVKYYILMRPYSFVFVGFYFPVITFILKNAGLKVITKNNNRLRGYYGKINNFRNTKQYGLMSI